MDNKNLEIFGEEQYSVWVKVILPLALPTVYTYALPAEFESKAIPGCRVEVVLGKNKKYAGIIRNLVKQKPAYATKPILNVLDDEPLLYASQLQLWAWISEYYMCSEGEVMGVALPANFKLSSETILIFNESIGEEYGDVSNEEFMLAEALNIRKQLSITEVQQILESTHVYPIVKKLIDKNICFTWEEMNEKYKIKKENFVRLADSYLLEENLAPLLNDWKGAPKQMELLLAFIHLSKTAAEVSQPELLKKSGASAAQLKALADKKIVIIESKAVDRIISPAKSVDVNFILSDAQESAYNELKESLSEKNVCLLHGVTGSGKTELYIKLIEENFKLGKQALYLLPEIALTAQIIRRLQKHFGGNIAVYHSKFNNQERIELWHKIRTGETKILLGARSAVFLPFLNLGLIIVDEEHDPSYKQQDPAPRYNARDAAIYYGHLFKAKVILGSATPSVESFYNTKTGKYGLVELKERYGGLQLPEIEIINIAQVVSKEKVMLSPPLKEAIEQTVGAGAQVILFQNRRGYNPYIICGTCGYLPQCVHCDVSLTLHKYSNKMHCHYCGSTYAKLIACPQCGTQTWLEKNFGTEKIEETLDQIFTTMKVARMDVDSVRGKQAHDNLIKQFEQKKMDILVGTQMVVKGLDFDNVLLVGILDADGLLSFADFRAHERAFQLMEQVSGRAGRREKKGKVIIQALNVTHPVLQWVKAHDYNGFYKNEIAVRQEFYYPPYCRLVLLTLKHKKNELVREAAEMLVVSMRQDLKDLITGPAAPVIPRIRNQYLLEIMIKLPKVSGKGINYKNIISNHVQLLHTHKQYRSVNISIDVDPM